MEGDTPLAAKKTPARPPTREELEEELKQELEQLRLSAYEEGFAKGHIDGLTRGRQEIDVQVQHLQGLINALARPFQELDKQVESELVALVIALVRQLVRREVRTDPGVVVAAVREALGVLPVGSRNVSLQLHPADAALMRERTSAGEGDQDFKITENPALTRGGCLVFSETSRVDATVERRLAEAILQVFGGERRSDAPSDGAEPDAAAGQGSPRAAPGSSR
jgi:flagellar assembly protein FliH